MRRTHVWTLLAIGIALLAVGAWLLRAGPRAATAIGPTPATSVVPPEPIVAENSATSRRTAAAPELKATTTSANEDVIVLVVERASGQPVAGANVRWAGLSATGPTYDRNHPLAPPDLEALLTSAPQTTTDATGTAHIDARVYPGIVCARLGALYGAQSMFERTAGPIRLQISADLSLSVQVVDANEKPVAGVPVGVRRVDAKPNAPDILSVSTNGPAGIARLAHVQEHPGLTPEPYLVVAHLAIVDSDVVSAPIDLLDPPKAPVKLVFPPHGSVVLHVHDSEGNALLASGVNMADTSQLNKDGTLAWTARTFDPSSSEEGLVLFPFVPLGLDLHVDAMLGARAANARGPGPISAGQEVTFDLDLGPPLPMFTGRLVDEHRAPLASCEFQCGFHAESTKGPLGSGGFPEHTTAAGRFRFVAPMPVDVPLTGSLNFKPYCSGFGDGSVADIRLDGPLHAGDNDLGDVVVHAPQLLASGRVVDDLGAPIPNAPLGGEVLETHHGSDAWESSQHLGGKCKSDGTFVLKGVPITGRLRIGAHMNGYVETERPEFACGAHDVSIVLSRASAIVGKVVVDDVDASTRISVRVERASDTHEQRTHFIESTVVHPDGTFKLENVRPGRCDLVFRRSGRGSTPVVIEGILLQPGENATDGRLHSIDLRGKLAPPANPPVSKPN